MNEELKPDITDDSERTADDCGPEDLPLDDGKDDDPARLESDSTAHSDREADDRKGLGGESGSPVTTGFVGSSGPSYIPIPQELRELARYWITEVLDAETFAFFTGQSNKYDLWTRTHGPRQLDRIAEVIGHEAVKEIISQVENEFQRRMGDRRWEVFQHGTEKDRGRMFEESYAESNSPARAPRYAVDYLAKEAVTIFPDLGRDELADAIRAAARSIEKGQVNPSPCDHDWQIDLEKAVHNTYGGFTLVFERCGKCRAMRERRVYSDGE